MTDSNELQVDSNHTTNPTNDGDLTAFSKPVEIELEMPVIDIQMPLVRNVIPLNGVAENQLELVQEEQDALLTEMEQKKEQLDLLADAKTDGQLHFDELSKEDQEQILSGESDGSLQGDLVQTMTTVLENFNESISGNNGFNLRVIRDRSETNKTVLQTYNEILMDSKFIGVLDGIEKIINDNGVCTDENLGLVNSDSIITIQGLPSVDELSDLIHQKPITTVNTFCPCAIKACIPLLVELNAVVMGHLMSIPKNDNIDLFASECHIAVNPNLAKVVNYTIDLNQKVFTSISIMTSAVMRVLPNNDELPLLLLTLKDVYTNHEKNRVDQLIEEYAPPSVGQVGTEGLTENGLYDKSINDFGNQHNALKLLLTLVEKAEIIKRQIEGSYAFKEMILNISSTERTICSGDIIQVEINHGFDDGSVIKYRYISNNQTIETYSYPSTIPLNIIKLPVEPITYTIQIPIDTEGYLDGSDLKKSIKEEMRKILPLSITHFSKCCVKGRLITNILSNLYNGILGNKQITYRVNTSEASGLVEILGCPKIAFAIEGILAGVVDTNLDLDAIEDHLDIVISNIIQGSSNGSPISDNAWNYDVSGIKVMVDQLLLSLASTNQPNTICIKVVIALLADNISNLIINLYNYEIDLICTPALKSLTRIS